MTVSSTPRGACPRISDSDHASDVAALMDAIDHMAEIARAAAQAQPGDGWKQASDMIDAIGGRAQARVRARAARMWGGPAGGSMSS